MGEHCCNHSHDTIIARETFTIIELDEVDSTQNYAKRLAAENTAEQLLAAPVVVVANTQTQGRGTQNRNWQSQKGQGLYFSLLLPKAMVTHWSLENNYPLLAAQACQTWLNNRYETAITVKPINDLIVEGKKLGGILVESSTQGSELAYLITGVGINIEPLDLKTLDPEANYQATSLSELGINTGRIDPADLASHLSQAIITGYQHAILPELTQTSHSGN